VQHHPDWRADRQQEVADAREKSRGVSGVVAIRVSQAFPIRRDRHDSKAGVRRLLSASRSRTYTTLATRRLCALRHTFAPFSRLATSALTRAGDD
jgi:hypothetical protein